MTACLIESWMTWTWQQGKATYPSSVLLRTATSRTSLRTSCRLSSSHSWMPLGCRWDTMIKTLGCINSTTIFRVAFSKVILPNSYAKKRISFISYVHFSFPDPFLDKCFVSFQVDTLKNPYTEISLWLTLPPLVWHIVRAIFIWIQQTMWKRSFNRHWSPEWLISPRRWMYIWPQLCLISWHYSQLCFADVFTVYEKVLFANRSVSFFFFVSNHTLLLSTLLFEFYKWSVLI